MSRLVIGSRGSPLALRQTTMIRDAIASANPGLTVEIEIIKTTGDRQQEWASPPAGPQAGGGKGIFVKEIEDALLERRVDAAVHSLKDMPTEIPEGLHLAAIPEREDPRDVLAGREGMTFASLPRGARLGTGSPRRVSQLRHRRSDLVFVPIRGNVGTRLNKVGTGELDAVILAAAGLRRLGLMQQGWETLDPAICLPAVGQGALAIEARRERGWVAEALARLHHPATAACTAAERSFLAALGGGCQVPVAALGVADGGTIELRGAVCDPEGRRLVLVEAAGSIADPAPIGAEAARRALGKGAGEILASIGGADGK